MSYFADFPIPSLVLKSLADRSYDKRKLAAQDIERVVRRLREIGDETNIQKVIDVLVHDFASNTTGNNRKGGLIGLASCAVALGSFSSEQLQQVIPAVLKSLNDSEPRIRYYACESLFNIIKVCRVSVLPYFNDIFCGACKLIADVDSECKNGAALLDRLLKEVVVESLETSQTTMASASSSGSGKSTLNLDRFIPLLKLHMPLPNPYVRQLTVGWISILDTCPGVDLLQYLPDFLSELFEMLSDGNRDVRHHAYAALSSLLEQIDSIPPAALPQRVRVVPVVTVLLNSLAPGGEKFLRTTSVEWLTRFISIGGSALHSLFPDIVSALLRALSDPAGELVEAVAKLNADTLLLLYSSSLDKDTAAFDGVLGAVLTFLCSSSGSVAGAAGSSTSGDVLSKSAALRWCAMLLLVAPSRALVSADLLVPAILQVVTDSHDVEVIKLALEVLARLVALDTSLGLLQTQVLPLLLGCLRSRRSLFESRASLVVRRLCLLLNARVVFCALAELLNRENNLEFASLFVELLNLLLLTSVETAELRETLRACIDQNGEAVPTNTSTNTSIPNDNMINLKTINSVSSVLVFRILFKAWCANPIAAFSLCLLGHAFPLGTRIVSAITAEQISVGLLMQTDKLVQLLETPIFLSVRLRLVGIASPPEFANSTSGKNNQKAAGNLRRQKGTHALRQSLLGLLMLLPQGTAFNTLRERLQAASSGPVLLSEGTSSDCDSALSDLTNVEAELLQIFLDSQSQANLALAQHIAGRSVLNEEASSEAASALQQMAFLSVSPTLNNNNNSSSNNVSSTSESSVVAN